MPSRQTRKRGGSGYSYIPAPVNYVNSGPTELNLGQGRQFAEMHVNQHGGSLGLLSGPYPGALGEALPQDLAGPARLLPLQKAFEEIKGMQDGGRRRKNRKSRNNRKNRKSRKSRSSRKNRKSRSSRKNRKSRSFRKNRKSRRGGRRGRRGGGPLGYQDVKAPGMLLTNAEYTKAGLNPEWELAKNPNAFAPVASRS